MNPLLNQFSPITHFNQLSFSQAKRLTKPDKVDASLAVIEARRKNYEADLDTIANSLKHINSSIIQYSSSTPLYKKFLHLFTGRYFKMHMLRRSLPSLIAVVNNEAMTLFKIYPLDLIKNAASIAAGVASQYPASTQFLKKYHEIKVCHSQELATQQQQQAAKQQTATKKQEAALRQQIENDLKWTPAARDKQQLLLTIQQLFQSGNYNMKHALQSDPNSYQMIDNYISDKLQSLQKNYDVTLPRFFYTEPNLFGEVVKTQKSAPRPFSTNTGPYVSVYRESAACASTFALTEEAVYPIDAQFFNFQDGTNGPVTNRYAILESPVKITAQTVAHVVSSTPQSTARFLASQNLQVPVISDLANDVITDLFQQALPNQNSRSNFPNRWKITNQHYIGHLLK